MSRQVKELPALDPPQKKYKIRRPNLVARFQAFARLKQLERLRKIYSALVAYFTQIIYEAFSVS